MTAREPLPPLWAAAGRGAVLVRPAVGGLDCRPLPAITGRFRTFPPASHRHDPITSIEAERDVSRGGGQRETHRRIVLDAVRNAPGQTASGYASMLHMELIEVRRRLSDLKYSTPPLVEMGEPVMARGRSKREMTWLPA